MIDFVNITKCFDGKTVLDGVSFSVKTGGVFGLVGTNGAGKSTLLRLAAGVYFSDSGEVLVDGTSVFDSASAKEKIVFINDDSYFPTGSTVADIKQVYSVFYKNFDSEEFSKITEYLGFKAEDKIGSFSKGMKKQLSVAAAISCNTEYVLFDETFDGIDPVIRSYVKKLMYEKAEKKNTTFLLTSHDLRETESLCDGVAILHGGKTVLCGEPSNIKTNILKVQVSIANGEDVSFDGLDIIEKSSLGSVYTVIIRGSEDETREFFLKKNPVILDFIPLTLEEIFIYETEALGYAAR